MTLVPRDGWSRKNDQVAQDAGHADWAAFVESVEEELGRSCCGRRTRSGRPCKMPEGWGTSNVQGACRRHGGASPAGVAHNGYRHGERSRSPHLAVTPPLRERIQSFLQYDPRRTLHLAAAALMARFEELLDRIAMESVGPESLAELHGVMERMRAADDPEALGRLVREAEGIVAGGHHQDETWHELYQVMDRLRGLSEVWRKVMADAGEMVERSRVLLLIDRVGGALVDVLEELELEDDQRRAARIRVAETLAGFVSRARLPSVSSVTGESRQ